jgi:hypothetical protein
LGASTNSATSSVQIGTVGDVRRIILSIMESESNGVEVNIKRCENKIKLKTLEEAKK